jgi:hypothetical protein
MNQPPDLAGTLSAVLPRDVEALDAQTAGEALRRVKALRGSLDAYEARVTTRITTLNATGDSAPAADLHTREGGVSSREAKQKEQRAKTLTQAPALGDKLAAGEVTTAHADALTNAASGLDEQTRAELFGMHADLAADAAHMTPEQFGRSVRDTIRFIERDHGIERDRRQRRDTRLTKTIDRDGMYILNGRFHPELGHKIFNAIDAETAKLVKQGGDRSADRRSIAADALGNLISGGHQTARPAEAEIGLLIDAATLIDGPHEHTVCEYTDSTPAPPTTVQRMMCNGRVMPIIIDTNGVVLNAGRDIRLANRTQRRALRAMYPTCAFHGCDIAFDQCEIHHLLPYELGGPTDLSNLLPLCSRHHHVIHQPGWQLHLDTNRTLTITRFDETWAITPLKPDKPTNIPPATDKAPTRPSRELHDERVHPPDRQLHLIA